jgi:hypothetical protein
MDAPPSGRPTHKPDDRRVIAYVLLSLVCPPCRVGGVPGTLPLVLAFLFFTDKKRANYFPSIPVRTHAHRGLTYNI